MISTKICVAVPAMRQSIPETKKPSLQFYKIKAGPPVPSQKLKQRERLELQNGVSASALQPSDSTERDQG